MNRFALLGFLVSPIVNAAIDILLLFPMVLSVVDVARSVAGHADTHEPVTITSTVALMMIGWGVALEERLAIRRVLGVYGRADEARQVVVDEQCHEYGVAQLVLGLFAEIAVAMIALPDRIININGLEHALLAVALVLIAIASLVQLRHAFLLLWGIIRPASPEGAQAA